MDLIEFLRARLGDDEAAIREDAGLGLAYGWPARLMAEVAAKRQVIEYAEATEDAGLPSECWALGQYMVRALAQPYADHPDFAPAWLLAPA